MKEISGYIHHLPIPYGSYFISIIFRPSHDSGELFFQFFIFYLVQSLCP